MEELLSQRNQPTSLYKAVHPPYRLLKQGYDELREKKLKWVADLKVTGDFLIIYSWVEFVVSLGVSNYEVFRQKMYNIVEGDVIIRVNPFILKI